MRTRCNQRKREINRKSAVNILAEIFRVDHAKIEAWIREEGLDEKLHRIAKEPSFLKETVNRLLEKRAGGRTLFSGLLKFGPRRLRRYDFENFTLYAADSVTGVEFDYCCHPRRGDPIVAFRVGNKAVVHHKFCEKAYQMIEAHTPMLFVEWNESRPSRYRVLITLKDEKGALARLLGFMAKIDINIIAIKLGDGLAQSNLCELVIESKENDKNRLKSLLERRFKVIEITSLTDAYKQPS
jgi:(p)ppGpp synthase/HD superfamily hydrolase